MTKLKCFALAAAMLASVSTAQAAMKIVSRSGPWMAWTGTASDFNTPMCMVSTTKEMRGISLKWSMGHDMSMHLTKNTWNIPQGIEMPVTVTFDTEAPFKGIAQRLALHRRVIELKLADPTRFMEAFKNSDTVRIAFPGGNEREWTFSLDGSDNIAERFSECQTALTKKYGGEKATQPFGNTTTTPQQDDLTSGDDPPVTPSSPKNKKRRDGSNI